MTASKQIYDGTTTCMELTNAECTVENS